MWWILHIRMAEVIRRTKIAFQIILDNSRRYQYLSLLDLWVLIFQPSSELTCWEQCFPYKHNQASELLDLSTTKHYYITNAQDFKWSHMTSSWPSRIEQVKNIALKNPIDFKFRHKIGCKFARLFNDMHSNWYIEKKNI